MRIDVVTIFPQLVDGAVGHGIMGRALAAGLVQLRVVNLRDYATDRHRTTDDKPCGGGGGMIMKPEPLFRAVEDLQQPGNPARIILTDPQGTVFNQAKAKELAQEAHLIFLCGRYEGVDERVRRYLATDELSIGDYVLSGGELPALVMMDAVVRLLPGALGNADAPGQDSFSEGLLEYPQYTLPRDFRGWKVPEILFCGHHERIRKWRRWHQLVRTQERRPDLWRSFRPTPEDVQLLESGEPLDEANP
ncbi:MAG: tRNA (guanosine(37)-N1)-methyltransferase TrmD [Chthonomonadales bacterium]